MEAACPKSSELHAYCPPLLAHKQAVLCKSWWESSANIASKTTTFPRQGKNEITKTPDEGRNPFAQDTVLKNSVTGVHAEKTVNADDALS